MTGAVLAPLCLLEVAEANISVVGEATCVPLCDFDTSREVGCHISRQYTFELIKAFDSGPWLPILSHHLKCQAMSNDICEQNLNCEVDRSNRCAASRSWVISRLALSSFDGGPGLGDTCGLFGLLLREGTACLQETDRVRCASVSTPLAAAGHCAWDITRQVCDVSHKVVVPALRLDYHDELLLVHFRRERCAAVSVPSMCDGDCRWRNDTNCSLQPSDALLAVTGEDCPLRLLLRSNAACAAETEDTCGSRKRADGLQECHWLQGRCEAHPVALDFDLLMFVGLGQPLILEPALAAQGLCSDIKLASSCTSLCASAIMMPSSSLGRVLATVPLSIALALAALPCFTVPLP